MTNKDNITKEKNDSEKVHPWRLCPFGEHWVRTHNMHIHPSQAHPEGYDTTRRGHCAKNPSRHDVLYPDEIKEIADRNFANASPKACSLNSEFGESESKYDDLIAGWTKYWNEVLSPDDPLDPNVVKALIATESSFDPTILANKKNPKSARGLMQITDETRKFLGNDIKGEFKDHFVHATRSDLNDPNINICAGIRWLFRKRQVASSILKRQANWEEAVYEFKGCRSATEEQAQNLINKFNEKLEVYRKCDKK
ncbi:MAG: transglycosylase SLT domain-containing protein [Bdellovibrionota bacterium]